MASAQRKRQQQAKIADFQTVGRRNKASAVYCSPQNIFQTVKDYCSQNVEHFVMANTLQSRNFVANADNANSVNFSNSPLYDLWSDRVYHKR